MKCLTPRLRDQRGISLVEIMVAVAIIGVLTSMAVMQIGAVRPGLEADGAMRVVMAQLNYARETAVAQRRLVEVRSRTVRGYASHDATCPTAPRCSPTCRSRVA
jgi:prepilin-type N-terminal cleavage/methylation domain-containing protein